VASTAGRWAAAVLTALATALVIVAVAVLPFLSPPWVAFEQGRANATAWTGFSDAELRVATDAILADLVLGPPDFDVEVNGAPVLNEREQAHMRDVRGVFAGFAALAGVAVIALAALYALARRRGHPERWWSAVRAGAIGLVGAIIVGGVITILAFDAAFEVFHRLFFAGGSYLFDPATDRLVQLFPFAFWSETTMVLGGVIVALAAVVTVIAGPRRHPAPAPGAAATASPVARPGSETVA
jgi:integral membrane protein (TIGR01906 family)